MFCCCPSRGVWQSVVCINLPVCAGAAIAERLAREGALVCLVARSEDSLRETARRCKDSGATGAAVFPCDLGNPQEVGVLCRAVLAFRLPLPPLRCLTSARLPPLRCAGGQAGCSAAGGARLHPCAGELRGRLPQPWPSAGGGRSGCLGSGTQVSGLVAWQTNAGQLSHLFSLACVAAG